MESPLHQFEIKTFLPLSLFGHDISITNATVFMMLSVGLIMVFFIMAFRKKSMFPSKLQALAEMSVNFIQNMMHENIGSEGKKFLPFILSLFMLIFVGNLLGMLPFSYTFTSQIIATFTLAAIVFILVTLIGFARHGVHFLKYFLPEGTPVLLAPLLIVIELISYLSRPISLSIRLFANMMAGHTMLKVFAMFTISLGVYGFSTIAAIILLIGFEFLVAFLQAYVFSVLTCLYLKDALHMH